MHFKKLAIAVLALNFCLLVPAVAAPVFNGSSAAATATKSPPAMSDAEYQQMARANEAKNEKLYQASRAKVLKQFSDVKQQNAAWSAQQKQAALAAAQQAGQKPGAVGTPAGMVQNPAAAPTPVFVNKKKDEPAKPVRLFNVK